MSAPSASIVSLSVTLPAAPKGAQSNTAAAPSPAIKANLLPAGPAFTAHARRTVKNLTFAEDEQLQLAEYLLSKAGSIEEEDENDKGLGEEIENRELLLCDPKAWKSQDHYAVLGLQSLRYLATPDQIKKAHRRKVLRHHPDKKASAGGEANDDSFFKCIAKAMEVLSDPTKRRQFDSVDAEVDDDDVPLTTTAENFYAGWGPVMAREGRFSKVQPVPEIGDASTPRKDVEKFYDFFYGIDSWRSFEYDDKDSPEGADSRDEKRHQEKKNKSERAKKKSADIARVRTLVDTVLAADPRIRQFKLDEKLAREAKKKGVNGVAAVDPVKKAAEEKAAADLAAQNAIVEAAKLADDKTSREAAKKIKAAALKNVKKDRKAISALVTTHNYFVAPGSSPSPAVVEGQLSELDLLFGLMEPEEIGELKKAVETASGADKVKAAIVAAAAKVEDKAPGKFVEFKA